MGDEPTGQPDTIKNTREWAPRFLVALAEGPNVSAACRAVGIGRSTAYDHRRQDAEFARGWDDALDQGVDELVGECYRRARHGVERPVYQGGAKVGTVTEYSDTLAIFLLKSHRPEVYGDRSKVDVTSGGQPQVQTILYMPVKGSLDPPPPDVSPASVGGTKP